MLGCPPGTDKIRHILPGKGGVFLSVCRGLFHVEYRLVPASPAWHKACGAN
jgi:hypothetical protein